MSHNKCIPEVYSITKADEPDYFLGGSDRSPLYHPKWNRPKTPIEMNRAIEPELRECLPTVITVEPRGERPLTDLVGSESGWNVSRKMKDLIEAVEPNVHQFFDVEVRYGRKKYNYYILKFGIAEDCYDLKKSDVRWNDYAIKGKRIISWSKKHAVPLAFKSGCVQNKQLWQNKSGRWMVLISGKLHDLFVEHDVTGVKYEKQIVIESE